MLKVQAVAAALTHQSETARISDSKSAAREAESTAALYTRFAADISVAAAATGTVLPDAEDPSLVLVRGCAILARERGSKNMLHDLSWFLRHAAGEDITVPELEDAICYGLVQVSDNCGTAQVGMCVQLSVSLWFEWKGKPHRNPLSCLRHQSRAFLLFQIFLKSTDCGIRSVGLATQHPCWA